MSGKKEARLDVVARGSIEKWAGVKVRKGTPEPRTPPRILVSEAGELAAFMLEHWEPRLGKRGHPGLGSAVVPGGLPGTAVADLRELALAVQFMDSEVRGSRLRVPKAPVERGRFLLRELERTLRFLFDAAGGVRAAEVARLREGTRQTGTHDALALALESFAYYAARHRKRLAALAGFDAGGIDEALVVANRLREQSALRQAAIAGPARQQSIAVRGHLLALLDRRMKDARRAARFVFRERPELARQAGSEYERTRRARPRAAKKRREQA
jgi:hypothetical protein